MSQLQVSPDESKTSTKNAMSTEEAVSLGQAKLQLMRFKSRTLSGKHQRVAGRLITAIQYLEAGTR
jgi:hypothetical protein